MGTLTIRNVESQVHARLRERAARHGRSVEAEVREILADAVQAPRRNLLLELREKAGGAGDELEIPARLDGPREADLP